MWIPPGFFAPDDVVGGVDGAVVVEIAGELARAQGARSRLPRCRWDLIPLPTMNWPSAEMSFAEVSVQPARLAPRPKSLTNTSRKAAHAVGCVPEESFVAGC